MSFYYEDIPMRRDEFVSLMKERLSRGELDTSGVIKETRKFIGSKKQYSVCNLTEEELITLRTFETIKKIRDERTFDLRNQDYEKLLEEGRLMQTKRARDRGYEKY